LHPNARPLAEAQRQLQLLQHQQEQLAPGLYRDLALYLQVLREGLLPAVQQACFHLATQVHPERYARLDDEQRRGLQERLRELSQRCGCLLTVEQLLSLAGQLERQRQRRERAEQRHLLEALAADASEPDAGSDGDGEDDHEDDNENDDEAVALPQGSVSLGLDLPLSADLFLQGENGCFCIRFLNCGAANHYAKYHNHHKDSCYFHNYHFYLSFKYLIFVSPFKNQRSS
jgi:hypothetical protein